MHTQQLICFVCVADKLNFTKAAEELFLSTPTVTHHIQTLENELKTTLFIRNSKMVQLTETGKEFYNDAAEILAKMELAEKKIQKIANPNTFYLHIGCTSNAELTTLQNPLTQLRQKHPNVYPQLHVKDYITLKNSFEGGQIDVLFTTKNISDKINNCSFFQLSTLSNCAVLQAASPLSQKTELFFQDLEDERLITLHPKLIPFEYSDELRNMLFEHRISHLDIHCENDQAGILMAECGFGIAVFPEFCIPKLPDSMIKIPFEKNSFSIKYGITYHKKIKNQCVKDFLEILKSTQQKPAKE